MKKTLSLILVIAMAVMAFAGCGCQKSNTFKIGGIGPTTGGAAIYGLAVQRGAEIAVEEINAAGGVNGVMLEFSMADDEHDPAKSVNAYNSLKDWGMQILMGTVTSGPCVAVAAETEIDNMFLLTPSGSAVDCVAGKANAFRLCFSDPAQGAKSAEYIAENGIAKKIAVIYDDSDVYSTGIYSTFKSEAAERGLEIVSETSFNANNKTDLSGQVKDAKSSGAELVFLPIYYSEAALILDAAKKENYAPLFFGCDGLDGLLTIEGFDTSLAEGVMLLTPFAADATDEQTVNFVTKYKEKYKETPNQFAADAYDCIYAIKAALEKSGATQDMSASELCELLKKAMTEITVDGLTGDAITWSADGEPDKAPKAVKIENGVYVSMDVDAGVEASDEVPSEAVTE